MDEKQQAGFVIGVAIGFDLDTLEVEEILGAQGLTLDASLLECQKAIHDHVGERRWQQGIGLIRQRMNAGNN